MADSPYAGPFYPHETLSVITNRQRVCVLNTQYLACADAVLFKR